MATNTSGYTGLDTKMVSDDSVTMIGLDPNTDPSCVIDESGRSRDEYSFSGTEGMTKWPAAYPEVKAIDNSGAHHGGSYTLVAMNKFNVDAGGGGINLNSSGNISLMGLGGIVNIVSSAQIEMFSDIVKLDSTTQTIINGPSCDINSDIFTVKKLAIFGTNAVVNGGLFVKGELYTSHITGTKDKYYTEYSPAIATYFSPSVNISGIMSISNLIPSGPYMPNSAICNVNLLLPNPAMLMQNSGYIMPHRHRFYHLAANLCDSPIAVWEGATSLEDTSKPKAPDSANNILNEPLNYIETRVADLTKTMVKQILF